MDGASILSGSDLLRIDLLATCVATYSHNWKLQPDGYTEASGEAT